MRVLAAVLGLLTVLALGVTGYRFSQPTDTLTGYVVDTDGQPVVGATVEASGQTTVTKADGGFALPARREAQWVRVTDPRFLPRTRAASPEAPVLIRLTPDDGETISLHFVGDMMFGRRFYDDNEDGDTRDGQLAVGANAQAHRSLIDPAVPLLKDADLTLVNLETPLIRNPFYPTTAPRPARFHPTKDFAFASSPNAATALRDAGVDLVGLGNNHLYDALDAGVGSTIKALRDAGYAPGQGYAGAGDNASEAWRPAVLNVRGQTVAVICCTTITGDEHPISYVATDTKGGAARATVPDIQAAVRAARSRYDVVVVMIHGGFEYARDPSPQMRQLAEAARSAGANLVVNHHPHVVGGLTWNSSSLIAWTMGNFLFDQTVWPTFESYLLAVHLRRGKVVRAYVEPLMIEKYTPKGLTGDLADYVARGAAGRSPGPFVVEDGAMEVDVRNASLSRDQQVKLRAASPGGDLLHLGRGWRIAGFSGPGALQVGRDLLWAGSFENETVGGKYPASAPLWTFDSVSCRVEPGAAYSGKAGARLRRGSADLTDVILTPTHRLLVKAGTALTVTGMARGSSDGAGGKLQVSWYHDTKGPSVAQTVIPLPASRDAWRSFRIDAQVPPGIVAAGVYLRLPPPKRGDATLDVDDVRVIEWAPPQTARLSPLYDFARVTGSGVATVRKTALPGGEGVWLSAAEESLRPLAP